MGKVLATTFPISRNFWGLLNELTELLENVSQLVFFSGLSACPANRSKPKG